MAETATESVPPARKITLKSEEGELIEIEERVARQSDVIKNILDEVESQNVDIPVPNVKASILNKVISYCTFYLQKKSDKEALKAFNKEFVEENWNILLDLITATNYLLVKQMYEFMCQAVANKMKKMSVEEVREYFGVVNDYTPEEEEEYRAKNKWAFKQAPITTQNSENTAETSTDSVPPAGSEEGELVEHEESVARQSEVIKNILDELESPNVDIPVSNVKACIVDKVISYCTSYLEKKSDEEALKALNKEFVEENWNIILNLITATSYMNEFLCQAVANKMKNMSIEEVREFFGVVNDFTPEEEQEYRAKNKWAFK
ncbi:SKP1 component, POZ domain [Dillenia turbinata]|uniref:SKP1 component, POZ domain n=1 Tax=Dillenia turbinata TaxID=194707 RepID=A0AAN8Z8F2_9MAGN